ncbi:hypothetical protein [Alkalimarinus alittae]|uniref:Uncharacterized protein n=1 Tax=Alkalimarinus alittae TaxID=2961619 RepID=A0ABY6MY91_9ALTE|nr:hypothetical protein [Alkalimarinus alittae]UZE94812.1 hypothetical protein NKI27_12060 [Alkalimarinus alittae]
MSNSDDTNSNLFGIVVYVSAQLKEQVTKSLGLFANTPEDLDQGSAYYNTRRFTIVTLEASFISNALLCKNTTPHINSELTFVICNNSQTERAIADAIRTYRIINKTGITYVDIIGLEPQTEVVSNKQTLIETKHQFAQGIRYWKTESYSSLINNVKASLYVLGIYFNSPTFCVDWNDLLWALTSQGSGVIFLQGESLAKLIDECCRTAKEYGGRPAVVMLGCATIEEFNPNKVLELLHIAEPFTREDDIILDSACYGPSSERFLTFIAPSNSWCWLGFKSKQKPLSGRVHPNTLLT